jgi:hypothetical protein
MGLYGLFQGYFNFFYLVPTEDVFLFEVFLDAVASIHF